MTSPAVSVTGEAAGHILDRASRGKLVVGAVLLILLAGAALRLVRIGDPPLAFQATRQYDGALRARKYEEAIGGSAAGLSRAVVRAAAPGEFEPPVLELVTAGTWRIVGSEPLWFPRVLSIAAWTIGGWFLFLLLRRLASVVAGIAGVVAWSFLPFGITVSRVFQPEPAMVAAVVAAVLALVIEDDEPNSRRLIIAGLAGGIAMFLKAPAVFFVAPVFGALTYRRGGWRSLLSRRSVVYTSLVVAPALTWYVYIRAVGGFFRLEEGAGVFVEPSLLFKDTFWRGWADISGEAFGIVVPLVAIAGILFAQRRPRLVGCALVAGYIAYGLVFTFHYQTHDYYHLPFVVVAAVGIGLLVDRAVSWIRAPGRGRPLTVALGLLLGVVLVGLAIVEPAGFPVVPAAVPEEPRRSELGASMAIGSVVRGRTDVVFLAPNFGRTLMYYGGFAGTLWPDPDDVRGTLDDLRRKHRARFFVVTDMDEWAAEPGLRTALRPYPLVASDRDYHIYDLR